MALISLANVLHRAHYSHEAAIVVHAALDVSRELNVNHFTLGNIYAVSDCAACHHIVNSFLLYVASDYVASNYVSSDYVAFDYVASDYMYVASDYVASDYVSSDYVASDGTSL